MLKESPLQPVRKHASALPFFPLRVFRVFARAISLHRMFDVFSSAMHAR
ncbi:hypothetical protein BRCON_2086 [Candidatus Sumerlaea chitinivorans]|uniref:Uncharacterized protein n=1 Tax=Sumerlaea chitinivorans TaxID=2250252 RepID=A0A2Z4Y8T7_SUMC1|nr:hypothetical protein BRCON_2086 [Candidatus Sumerlaea chitinivorans]